jgi:hypothetical protein
MSDEFAKWIADSWLDSFCDMYETSYDNANGIEEIDHIREILRRKISVKEKLMQLEKIQGPVVSGIRKPERPT